jgi:large subunit ribosomal protein L3
MPSVGAMPGLIGRKVGMMTLYDGGGRARGVTVIEVAGNRVTQIRTSDRDGYEAIQVGAPGKKKKLTRPERGHLAAANAEREALGELQEFHVTDIEPFELGQALGADQFETGTYLNVTGTSKGRGFAGVVRRWNFRGGPKTHGQSDRHRAPGSIGAGTTPGKVWKGQKMGGHMGNRQRTSVNMLLVYADPARQLLFVEGSVAGPVNGIVSVTPGRKKPLADYVEPELSMPEIELPPEPEVEEPAEKIAEDVVVEAAADETPEAEVTSDDAPEASADEAASEVSDEAEATDESSDEAEPEAADESADPDDEEKSEG